jgi:fluoride exporter
MTPTTDRRIVSADALPVRKGRYAVTIWFLVGAGGAIGAMTRHGVNGLVHRLALSSTFPFGIVLVNVTGSIAIGLFAGLLASNRIHASLPLRTFLIVGVLGGYTTFSSFSFDTFALLRDGHAAQAIWNIAGQVGLCLAGVWVGFWLGTKV